MRAGQALSPTRTAFAIAFALAGAGVAAACSDGGASSATSGGGTGGHDTSSATTTSSASSSSASSATGSGGADGGGDPTPAESCIKPGDHGNDKGVGEYCTPGGGECAKFPEAGFCLADVGQKQWFCTRIGCATDAECGADATCFMNPQGSGCVPNKCLDSPDGGSPDGGSPDGG